MHRTLVSRTTAATTPGRGSVAILPWFEDADRGRVACPAALVLAEDLRRLARRAGLSTTVTFDPDGAGPPGGADQSDGAEMFSTSYVDRRGTAAGFAAIVADSDQVNVDLVRQAQARWFAALRSRRLLLADISAPCLGVLHAASAVGAAAENDGEVRMDQPMDCTGLGRVDLGDGRGVFVTPVFGIGPEERALAEFDEEIVDGTCPLVAKVRRDIAAYAARGDTVVLIGSVDDAATRALAEVAPSRTVLASAATDIPSLTIAANARISFVVSSAWPVERAMAVVAALRRRFPALCGHHFDVLCDTASERAQAIAAVADASDLMLIGARDAQDDGIRVIRDALAAQADATAVHVVTSPEDLDVAALADATTIGLAATPNAAPGLSALLSRVLGGLGPLTVRRRSMSTADISIENDESLHDPAHAPQIDLGVAVQAAAKASTAF